MLALLAVFRRTSDLRIAGVVVVMAVCAEGSVGLHMLWLGFPFGWIPLAAAAVVVTGVAIQVVGLRTAQAA